MSWKDRIKGGKADTLKPSMFPRRALQRGTKHEMEHTNDWKKAMEIAMDHLAEDARYYYKLEKMERSSKKDDARLRKKIARVEKKKTALMKKVARLDAQLDRLKSRKAR